MLKSERQLKRMYNKFNVDYFDGELPDVKIHYEPVSAYADCDKVDGEFVIRINPSIGGWFDFLELTLIHEMVHVKLWPTRRHTARFDQEIARLMTFKKIRALV